MKILLVMYLCTRKSSLNLGSQLDAEGFRRTLQHCKVGRFSYFMLLDTEELLDK